MSRYAEEVARFLSTYPDAAHDIDRGLRTAADAAEVEALAFEDPEDEDYRRFVADAETWRNLADELQGRETA